MRRLTVNTVYLTLEKGAHLIGAMLLMIGVARLMGDAVLAEYAFVIGLTSLFVPILDAGFNNRVIKATASGEAQGRDAVGEALGYKLRLTVPTLILMAVAAWVSADSRDVVLAVLLVGVSTVAMSLGDAFNSVLKGMQRPAFGAAMVGGLNALLFASAVAAMAGGSGLVGVAACYAVCRIAYGVVAPVVVSRVDAGRLPDQVTRVQRREVLEGLRHLASVYFLGNLLHADYITTYLITGGHESAEYAIGYRVASALLVLCTAGFEAVLPDLTQRFQNAEDLKRALVRSTGVFGALGFAVAAATQLAAEPAVQLVFGTGYAGAVGPVRLLAWSVPVFAVCGVAHTVLMATNRQGQAAITMLVLFLAGAASGALAGAEWGARATAVTPTAGGAAFAVALFAMAWRACRGNNLKED